MAYISDSEYTKNVLVTLNAARLAGIPCVLWGSPGTGKTELIKALGKQGVEDPSSPTGRRELPVKILLGSIMDPTDLSGLPAIRERHDEENNTDYLVTENTRPDWADDLMKAGEGILFLDELNNATPTMQSAELSLLQGRQVGQYVLPNDVWILAASNEPEDAADGHDLTPPMANRLLHIEWNPPIEDWIKGMRLNWGEPTTTKNRGVHEMRVRIAAFVNDHPNLLQQQPTSDAEAGKAWSSRRSWDNAAKALGDVTAPQVRHLILKGLVGDSVAVQFFTWEKALALPSNEEVLKESATIDWRSMKTDAVYTIVTRITAFTNIDNAIESAEAMKNISKAYADIVSPLFGEFIARARALGVTPAQLAPTIRDIAPYVKNAGLMGDQGGK